MTENESQQPSSGHVRKERARVSSQKGRSKLNSNYKILNESLSFTPYAKNNATKADLLLNAALYIKGVCEVNNRLSEENKRLNEKNKRLNEEKEECYNNIDRLLTLIGEREILINEVNRLNSEREILINEMNRLNNEREYFIDEMNINEVVKSDSEIEILDNELN
ncbi:8396_t:CDS:2, partial [Cetraspora pellucida]